MMTAHCGKDNQWPRAPQWMKSMEERYQRLHARVTDQAVKFTQTRNSVAGRLRELRQKKYAQRTALSHDCFYDRQNKPTPKQKTLPQASEKYTPQTLNCLHSVCKDTKQKRPRTQLGTRLGLFDSPDIFQKDDHTTTERGYGSGHPRPSSAMPSVTIGAAPALNESNAVPTETPRNTPDSQRSNNDSDGASQPLHNEERFDHGQESEGSSTKDHTLSNTMLKTVNKESENTQERILTENEKSICGIKDSQQRADVSVSATTQQIHQSCSTEMGKQSQKESKSTTELKTTNKAKLGSSKRKLQSKSAMLYTTTERRRSVFDRMSLEAQHAIGETMKEMTIAEQRRSNKKISNEEINTTISPAFSRENSQTNEKKNGDTKDDKVNENLDSSIERLSMYSSAGSDLNRDRKGIKNSHFHCSKPSRMETKSADAVGFRKDREDIHRHARRHSSPKRPQADVAVPHQSYLFPYPAPLPAIQQIRNWPLRDDSFNITSPEFDVRFYESAGAVNGKENDDISYEEIRKQSIEKCRLWLEKQ